MSMIEFDCNEGVQEPSIRRTLVRAWLKAVAEQHGKRVRRLSYQFCNDEQILEANRQYLQHDYYTDIITFDDSEAEHLVGDMLISLETVASNAELMGQSFANELHRVLVHGVLHLCGYGDKSEDEEQRMRALEDDALALLVKMSGRKSLLK